MRRFAACLILVASSLKAAPARLSEAGLYQDIAAKAIATTARVFSPQYPLWSDGAEKRRWIQLPAGKAIDGTDWDHWEFPVGTRLWKEFVFSDANGRPHRVETRLMEKLSRTRWEFTSYLWNEKETEAERVPQAGKLDVYPLPGGAKHEIPSVAQCKTCHARGGDPVLGFEALQLSGDRDPMGSSNEAHGLTVKKLVDDGLLENAPSDPRLLALKIRATTAIARAALGYLHSNCGSCHNPAGSAVLSALRFRHEGDPENEMAAPGYATAVRVATQYFKLPQETTTYQIAPGSPEKSAVTVRMKSAVSPVRMPMIATKRVDTAGLKLVEDWVRGIR